MSQDAQYDVLCIGNAIVDIIARAEEDFIHFGLTVTKKIGNAVTRNRIKRRLRALVSEVLSDYGNPDYQYVLIARKAALHRSFDKMEADLKYALHTLHG